jgi:hypothetical protein
MRVRLVSVSLFLTLALAATAAAQGTTSRLVGQVTDSTGGVLPGVTVTLANESTGVKYNTVTTGAGTYVFEAIPSGTYTVTCELLGFKTFTSTGNRVVVGQPTAVDAQMAPGAVSETVEVTGRTEVVQTANSGNLGSVIDQKTIEAFPLVSGGGRGRNPLDMVTIQPGVVSGANTGGTVHVNGARDRSWNYTLDGIDTNETSAGGSNFSPLRANPDSLSEFKILTGNTTAEFGRNSGGQVAMITRSGTNQLRGTGFYFMRRPSLNANEWEYNLQGIPKRKENQDIYGFSLGGPIRQNKLFFFVNTQLLRATRTVSVTSTVYTDTAKKGLWRYVIGGRNQPYGVAGASVDSAGNVLPGLNIGTYSIPANDPASQGLNPAVQQMLSVMPSPNTFTTGDGLNTAGHLFDAPEEEKQHDITFRLDYAFSNKHSFFGRVAFGQQNTFCDSANAGLARYPGGDCVVNTYRSPINYAVSWRWNPGGSIVNEFVFGQNNFFFDFQETHADATKYTWASPGWSSPVTLPEEYYFGNKRSLNTFQFVDNLAWAAGPHMLKFGMNLRFQSHTDTRGSVGSYNASPALDFSTSVNTVDLATFKIPSNINTTFDRGPLLTSVNFLLGRVGGVYQSFVSNGAGNAYLPGGSLFDFKANYTEMDFFAQDTWRVGKKLTVDLGLRWELKMAPTNGDNLIRRPDQLVRVGAPATSTLKWVTGSLYENDVNNVGPSIGASWDPKGDSKSVVRANYRLAYDRINTFLFSSAIFQSIPGITASIANTDYGTAGGRLSGTLPALQPTTSPTDFVQPPATGSSSMRVVDPSFQSPMTHGWAISYQREVFRDAAIFEAAYVGRKADHLFGAYNVNQAEIFGNGFLDAFNVVKAGGESALMNQLLAPHSAKPANMTGSQWVRSNNASQLTLNSVAGLAQTFATRVQGGVALPVLAGLGPYFFYPYPQFLGGVNVIDSGDWSSYQSMQLKLERRFRSGWGGLIGYTLARSKDTRSFDPAFTVVGTANAQSASSTPFDIKNRGLNYARSDFDRLHSLQATFVAELPFGQGKWIGGDATGVLQQIIGGWETAAAITWQSGRPFTIYSGSNTLSNVVQTPADCANCASDLGYVHDEGGLVWYIDPAGRATFTTPAAGAFGTAGRNSLTGPRWFNISLTLSKRFIVTGRQSLEVRADALNLTNTPSFGLPTATTTSATFGRIYNTVSSYSRKIVLGVKYYF